MCFAAGTMIATPTGDVLVEDLRIGDLITTADGSATAVLWIGLQTLNKTFMPPDRFTPVRVSAGALGDGAPVKDLVLTSNHALILDGLAINASALVNGQNVRFEPLDALPENVTYYHIETKDHQVIFADGAAAETYVDYAERQGFDNYDEYCALFGNDRLINEMPFPRISAQRLVPREIVSRIAQNMRMSDHEKGNRVTS
ncbi:Hint domain-containing protein [Cognatishimia sp. F0-27]|nr:Hint domain-containing protein [Cognatishimia sp. F0-27]